MTIRTRLTFWYAAVVLLSLVVIAGGLYFELVIEPTYHERKGQRGDTVPEEIGEVILFFVLPVALIKLVGGWWLLRKAMSPIAALTDATERISAHNLKERLPRTGNHDELDRLSEVLNAMLSRLDRSFAQEREFTLHASHELKTPLTVMRGQIETALREEALTVSQNNLLADHLEEIQRLASIVDSLSLLAKADAGLLQLHRELIPFDELVRDMEEDLRMLALAADLSVEVKGCEAVLVSGDRHRLRQLLLNLAGNAVKHNQPGGWVRISLARQDGWARLEIANSGPGISAEALPRVFNRFFRADAAHNPNVEGSGLGLSIAQWIVHAHDGHIRVNSKLGVETVVTVQLPVARSVPVELPRARP